MFDTFKKKFGFSGLGQYRLALAESPLDGNIHYDFSKAAARFGQYNLALSELKSAEFLGYDATKIAALKKIIEGNLSDCTELDVNQYQRFKVLQFHLKPLLKDGGSVLDIGGGHGILSQFIPTTDYFLIEPAVNGISGEELPFSDNSFDVVVTCHVLEHIPANKRSEFINELLRVAKHKVLIFNPFKSLELDDKKRMELVLDVTNASWAREHLECGLPEVKDVCDYISSRGLSCTVHGYGDIYAATSTIFMSYFAGKRQLHNLKKINKHLNQSYDQLQKSRYPTNIMIEVTVRL